MTESHPFRVDLVVNAPTAAEGEEYLQLHLPKPGRYPGLPPAAPGGQPRMRVTLESVSITPPAPRHTPYDRLLLAEEALADLGTTTSQVDLANVIRAVVSDQDHLQDPASADRVTRAAYDHFVSVGGVDYDTAVGELLYSTVRDAVSEAMRDQGYLDAWYVVAEFNTEADGSPVPTDAAQYPRCIYGPFPNEDAAVTWMQDDYPDGDTDVHDMWAVNPTDAADMDLSVVNDPTVITTQGTGAVGVWTQGSQVNR